MNLPSERRGCRSLLTELVVGLAFLGGIIVVGSIWPITLPSEWHHGWRSVFLYLAILGGLILGGLIVGLVIVSWPKTEDEWGEWIIGLVKTVLFWGPVAVVLYIAWHFITKYW